MSIIKLSKIKIKKTFKESVPKEEKMQKCREYWLRNGKQDRDIVLDKQGYLIDGYIQYLVLKENSVKNAEIKRYDTHQDSYHNKETVYVYGVHCDDITGTHSKEFVWRVPPIWIEKGIHNKITVGCEVFVWTRRGLSKIKVTKIESLSEPPVPFRVKKVAWIE